MISANHLFFLQHHYQPAMKPGVEWGQCPQLNDLAHPCLPIAWNLDHLAFCYCLFYLKYYRLKLTTEICEGAFSHIAGNVIVMIFSGGKPPEPFCCLYGTIKDIFNVMNSIEGVVIKAFLVSVLKLLASLCVR